MILEIVVETIQVFVLILQSLKLILEIKKIKKQKKEANW